MPFHAAHTSRVVDSNLGSPPPSVELIDIAHLRGMTLGDRSLEQEVLTLFIRQSEVLLPRIRGAAPGAAATLAHTLKGSARSIGAWRVACAAEALELSTGSGSDAIAALEAAILETRAEIARLLASC